MAATFDRPLLGKIGEVVSIEARAKHNEADRNDIHSIYFGLTIWSPNINIFRDPRWGRGQETYGEDPFLTATLGTAFVNGLQGDNPKYFRTIATPKHYAVHSGPESTRHKANIDPTPHDLWDTYLPAFRATIVDAKANSIMCAYNAINGKPACASDLLLQDILRKDWRFDGFVTSDCGAIDDFYMPQDHHTSSDAEHASADGIRAGTDTNCGKTYLNLADAVHKGVISESEIDVSLKRLFTARMRLGLFDPPAQVPYASIPFSEVLSPAHTAIALQSSREAMVLLKNSNNILPLSPAKWKTIAVIGPNAASLAAIEGNYNAIPRDPVLPVDGLAAKFPNAKILYAQGSPYAENAATIIPRTQLRAAAGSAVEGLKGEYFDNDNLTGPPAVTRTDKQIDFDWNGASPIPGKINYRAFSVRWTGTMQAPAAGDYQISGILAHCNPCRESERYTIQYQRQRTLHLRSHRRQIATRRRHLRRQGPHRRRAAPPHRDHLLPHQATPSVRASPCSGCRPSNRFAPRRSKPSAKPTSPSRLSASRPIWKAKRCPSTSPASPAETAPTSPFPPRNSSFSKPPRPPASRSSSS